MSISSPPTRRHVLGLLGLGLVIALPSVGTHVAWARDDRVARWRYGEDTGHGAGGGSGCRRVRHGSSSPRSEDPPPMDGGPVVGDISVQYSDGWQERIADGSYELVDPQSRLVVRRSASIEDFDRMSGLR